MVTFPFIKGWGISRLSLSILAMSTAIVIVQVLFKWTFCWDFMGVAFLTDTENTFSQRKSLSANAYNFPTLRFCFLNKTLNFYFVLFCVYSHMHATVFVWKSVSLFHCGIRGWAQDVNAFVLWVISLDLETRLPLFWIYFYLCVCVIVWCIFVPMGARRGHWFCWSWSSR